MALPLPRVVADVEAGGPFVTSLKGINALRASGLENALKEVKAQYAPLTTQAEAASKLAYANLMGPQFLSKLFGNEHIVANLPEDKKREVLSLLQQTGMQGNPLAYLGQYSQPRQSPLAQIVGGIKNAFGFGQQPQQQVAQNQLMSPPQSAQYQQPMRQSSQGDEYQPLPNQPEKVTPPEQLAQVQQTNEEYYGGEPAPKDTYAENVGRYKGIAKEGEESGKLRAADIQDLNNTVFNADTKLETLNDINSMLASPEIRKIRQLPILGQHEIGWYSKYGTPAQQQLIGRLYAQLGNVVKDSSRDFAGQFRVGEQKLLSGMKPNPGDTIDTMIGKSESLTVMTKLLRERSALTSMYMEKYHISKLEAQKLADKEVHGNEIREQVRAQLNPTLTIRNSKGEELTLPYKEAMKKLRGEE